MKSVVASALILGAAAVCERATCDGFCNKMGVCKSFKSKGQYCNAIQKCGQGLECQRRRCRRQRPELGGPGAFEPEEASKPSGTSSDDLCHATCKMVDGKEYCSFKVIYDPYASSTGYYTFAECGSTAQPTIAMKRGVTYTFDQSDASNWFHPLGFAYFADGAHKDVDELEPGISQSGSACADNNTCQAPMYFKDNKYLGGSYDNTGKKTVGGDDFGLDVFEPEFFANRADWQEAGDYSVKLTLTDMDYTGDMFYFCHIHDSMSGRIKVVDEEGKPINSEDTPELGYEYEIPDVTFDAACGTFGLAPFRRGAGMCDDEEFVCETAGSTITNFGECLWAMDCHMHVQMKSYLHEDNAMVTFIHQMIPHHENAVNMAKAMLFEQSLDLEDEADAEMDQMVWSIINGQNHQITQMRGWLKAKGYDLTATCAQA